MTKQWSLCPNERAYPTQFQDSQKLHIKYFPASVSPDHTLLQQPDVPTSTTQTAGPFSIFWNQLEQQCSWSSAANNQAGNWLGKLMVLVEFFRFTRTQWAEFRLSLTKLIPTSGVPQILEACRSSSVSHPWAFPNLHTVFALYQLHPCSLCNGLRLPSPPHHTALCGTSRKIRSCEGPMDWPPHHRSSVLPYHKFWTVQRSIHRPTREEYGSFSAHTMVLPPWDYTVPIDDWPSSKKCPMAWILTTTILLCCAFPCTCVMPFSTWSVCNIGV